jgi:CRISPR-associated protein Csh1
LLDDSDYIIFYLDLPLCIYQEVHKIYLDKYLFNTTFYNTEPDFDGLIYGTSNFMNGYNTSMPFLKHQTATFEINGRISNIEAKLLNDFINILPNKTLPNPLPIFIYKEEIQRKVISIFRESGFKFGYKDIIHKLMIDNNDNIENYYLLYWQNTKDGIVFRDFDFVSRFEYSLFKEKSVVVLNLFEIKEKGGNSLKHYPVIKNVFEFEKYIFHPFIQNKYFHVDYFSDLNKEDYTKRDLTFSSFCNIVKQFMTLFISHKEMS